ncbi:MAG: hypothetical protein ACKV1O_30485 [Saprospiraceae bacterium]
MPAHHNKLVVGGRYAINSHIGLFSELGLGISVLSGGISWQFR